MKILDKKIPLEILKVYQEWLNIMELQHNEMVFTMFIEDVLKTMYEYKIANIQLKENMNVIYVNYSSVVANTFYPGFYNKIFDDKGVENYFLDYMNKFYNENIRN